MVVKRTHSERIACTEHLLGARIPYGKCEIANQFFRAVLASDAISVQYKFCIIGAGLANARCRERCAHVIAIVDAAIEYHPAAVVSCNRLAFI